MSTGERDSPGGCHVILVRHGEPAVDASLPASAWPLNARGAGRVRVLADQHRPYAATLVVTSGERKAIDTGRVIAATLSLATTVDETLNEQGRDAVPFFADRAAFHARVRAQFQAPNEVILGAESARAAVDRFASAVRKHAARDAPAVLVSHGRVLAGYLARLTGGDSWSIWRSLTMPDAYLCDPAAPGGVRRIRGM